MGAGFARSGGASGRLSLVALRLSCAIADSSSHPAVTAASRALVLVTTRGGNEYPWASAEVVGLAMFGAIIFIPLFLQLVYGVSPASSRLRMLPLMAGLLAASVLSGRAISRIGRASAAVGAEPAPG